MLGEIKAGLLRITRDTDPHDSVHGQQDGRGHGRRVNRHHADPHQLDRDLAGTPASNPSRPPALTATDANTPVATAPNAPPTP